MQSGTLSQKSQPKLPAALAKIGFGPTQLRSLFGGTGVCFVDGIDLILIPNLAIALDSEFHLGPTLRGAMISIVLIGQVVGSLFAAPVADRFGRRPVILASLFGTFAFGLVSTFAMRPLLVIFCRFVVATSLGAGIPVAYVHFAEVTPPEWRAVPNGIAQVALRVGHLYAGSIVYIDDPTMRNLDWQKLLQMEAFPALLLFVGAVPLLRESPFFLAKSGRYAEAQLEVANMQSENRLPDATFDVDFKTISHHRDSGASILEQWSELWSVPLVVTNIVVIFTFLTQYLAHMGSVYALPLMMEAAPGVISPARAQILACLWEVLGVALPSTLGIWLQRRTILKIGLFVLALLCTVMANGPGHQTVYYSYLGIRCMCAMVNMVAWVYASEVYPTSIRATGTAVSSACGKLGGLVLAPIAFEVMHNLSGSYYIFFAAVTGVAVMNFFAVYLLTFETYNAPLVDTIDGLVDTEASFYGATERVLGPTTGSIQAPKEEVRTVSCCPIS